jgi:hypothetical protein
MTSRSADRWPTLPSQFTQTYLSRAMSGRHEVHGGVVGSQGPWRPLRPLVIDRAEHEHVGRVAARLMRLILDACMRRASTAGELQDLLGVPLAATPLLRRDEPLGEHLLVSARPDIVYADGVARFVEFNIDGALGGTLQADLLATRFLDCYPEHDNGSNGNDSNGNGSGSAFRLSAPPSAVDARFALIRSSLGLDDGARVAIPVFRQGAAPGLEESTAFLAWLQPMCASGREHGLDTVACEMDQLVTGPREELLLDGRRVDAVFRLFLSFDQPPGPGLEAVARAVHAGTVAMHTPEASWLLSDKTTLAWLWEDRHALAPDDRHLVELHVPATEVFPAPATAVEEQLRVARAHRAALVLKPGDGYGGAGVVLGAHVSDEAWAAALSAAAERGRHVLQRHVEPDRLHMDVVHLDTGQVEWVDAPFVLGPFLFGGVSTGVLVRHGAPGTGPVLNAHHGALVSSVLLLEQT